MGHMHSFQTHDGSLGHAIHMFAYAYVPIKVIISEKIYYTLTIPLVGSQYLFQDNVDMDDKHWHFP